MDNLRLSIVNFTHILGEKHYLVWARLRAPDPEEFPWDFTQKGKASHSSGSQDFEEDLNGCIGSDFEVTWSEEQLELAWKLNTHHHQGSNHQPPDLSVHFQADLFVYSSQMPLSTRDQMNWK